MPPKSQADRNSVQSDPTFETFLRFVQSPSEGRPLNAVHSQLPPFHKSQYNLVMNYNQMLERIIELVI